MLEVLETPVLSAKDMASYIASQQYKDYQARSFALFAEIHGKHYSDMVKHEVKKMGKLLVS